MSRDKFKTLTEPMYYTLLCLREPACGADVMQQVAAMTGGAVHLGPGTLYHLLDEFRLHRKSRRNRPTSKLPADRPRPGSPRRRIPPPAPSDCSVPAGLRRPLPR